MFQRIRKPAKNSIMSKEELLVFCKNSIPIILSLCLNKFIKISARDRSCFPRSGNFLAAWSKVFQSCFLGKSAVVQGPVARSLVNANRWLRGIKMYRFPRYLTLVSTNHASSNPGQYVTKCVVGERQCKTRQSLVKLSSIHTQVGTE